MGVFFAIKDLDLSVGDAFLVLLLGLGLVVGVLVLVIGIITVMKYILGAISKPESAKENVAPKSSASNNVAAPAVLTGTAPVAVDDNEEIAAVMAAITCILQEEANVVNNGIIAPFVIRKIKNISIK